MPSSLIRSRAAITRAIDRNSIVEIKDGAIFQEDGVIREVGTYADLRQKYPAAPVIGTGGEILLPGFINAHHHVGLTPFQLGSPDMPLEPWLISRMKARIVDPYLDTLYAAFEMIASGVTTVQHIQIGTPGTLKEIEAAAGNIIKAYEAIGMRASYSFAASDQNRLVYENDDVFTATLPEDMRGPTRRWLDRFKMRLEDHLALFQSLHSAHAGKRRIAIQLSPSNLQWCSDRLLAALAETSSRLAVPMHMHLVETSLQRDYAIRRGGVTAIDCLDRLGLLGPRLTIGHGVWLGERDLDRIAETGTCICHNCSSNFRLCAGIAPLNRIEARGINCAIGIDEAGLNDDRDMLQEMRLVLRAHRLSEPALDVPTTAQVFRMATVGGARTTSFGESIGTIEVGKAADIALMDWDQVSYPFLDEETSTLDALILRAKTVGVTTVVCDGEVIYHRGQFTRVDHIEVLRALHASAAHVPSEDELERRWLSKRLLPRVADFYSNYPAASDRSARDDGNDKDGRR
jgi:cytosine/adenosine deaminase-related metal-dependent hydrolase